MIYFIGVIIAIIAWAAHATNKVLANPNEYKDTESKVMSFFFPGLIVAAGSWISIVVGLVVLLVVRHHKQKEEDEQQ